MSSPSTTCPGVVRFRSPWCTLRDLPLRTPVVLALGNPAMEVAPPAAVPVDVGGGGVVPVAEEGGLGGGVPVGGVGGGELPAAAGDSCPLGGGARAAAVPDAAGVEAWPPAAGAGGGPVTSSPEKRTWSGPAA